MIFLFISIFIIAIIVTGVVLRERATSGGSVAIDSGHYLEINGTKIILDIADTHQLREQGLSGKTFLAPNRGMLFVFQASDYWAFWMKDMHFSIDIIYLDAEYRVITTFKNIKPETYPASFKPSSPARYVLETNTGFVESNRIVYQEQLKIK